MYPGHSPYQCVRPAENPFTSVVNRISRRLVDVRDMIVK